MPWEPEEFEILKANYGKIKIEDLERLLPNKKRKAIQKYANTHGLVGDFSLAQRKYFFNEHFFDEPNPENCYWAGFIAADGCLSKGDSIIIRLAVKDICILKEFARAISFTGPVTTYFNNGFEYCAIQIWGAEKWRVNLPKYWNITPHKSNTLQPPTDLSAELAFCFLIGYIDGDGSFCWCYEKRCRKYDFCFSVCGTYQMMDWMGDLIQSLIGGNKSSISRNGISKTNKTIRYKGSRAIDVCVKLLTIDIPWRLPRKWTKIDCVVAGATSAVPSIVQKTAVQDGEIN